MVNTKKAKNDVLIIPSECPAIRSSEFKYIIFLECRDYATDDFWKKVFENLAYGITPHKGVHFRELINTKSQLYCSYKNKNFEIEFDNNSNSQELYNQIYTALTNRLCVYSKKDQINKLSELITDQPTYTSWSEIRKKSVKDMLLKQYAIECMKKHGLTLDKCRKLLSVIIVMIAVHIICSEHIVFENNKIQDIHGIQIKNGDLEIDPEFNYYDLDYIPLMDTANDKTYDISEKLDDYIKSIKSYKLKRA